MDRPLADKVALVTGAGKGSGRTVAEVLARQGARLAVNDISPVNLDETAARIRAAGGEVRTYVEDLSKKMIIQGLLNTVLEDFGRLDLLVHAAEVEPQKSILEMDDWDWQRVLDVNLTGAFLLLQSAGRIMTAGGGGTLLLLGDRARGTEKHAAYLASKAGLAALAKTAAEEFAPLGVRVRLVTTPEEALKAALE